MTSRKRHFEENHPQITARHASAKRRFAEMKKEKARKHEEMRCQQADRNGHAFVKFKYYGKTMDVWMCARCRQVMWSSQGDATQKKCAGYQPICNKGSMIPRRDKWEVLRKDGMLEEYISKSSVAQQEIEHRRQVQGEKTRASNVA